MIRFLRNAVLLFHLVILGFRVISALAVEEDSWPMQYALVDDRSNDRYIHFMQGCYQTYGKTLCDANERDRIALNLHQPAWQTNFTSTGYVKARLSDAAFLLFQDFWDLHSCETQHLRKEAWNRGSIYVNHWEASTKLLFLDDPEIGMSVADRTFLQQEVQSVLSKWSGTSLTPSWFYGIRVYQKGSIVAPHVDRYVLRM